MKRIYSFMVAAVASFAAISCTQELQNNNQLPEGEVVVFEATVDVAGTKAVLDGKVSKWESTDKITIISENGAYEFATTADDLSDDATSATFKYVGDDFAGTKFMAVYPAGNYTLGEAEKTVNAYIPTYQKAHVGNYSTYSGEDGVTATLAVAYSENQSLEFKNACALLKFNVSNENITHVKFYGNNQEAITGNMLVSLDGDNSINSVVGQKTTFTWEDGTSTDQYGTWVEMHAFVSDDDEFFKAGKDNVYYIAVAPCVFTKGFAVKVKVDGEEHEIKKYNEEYDLKPNTILNLGTLTYDPNVVDASAYGLVGSFQGWDPANSIAMEYVSDGWIVAKNVELYKSDEFKFVTGNSWNNPSYGTSAVTVLENNVEVDVVTSGSQNMKVSKNGEYNLYLNPNAKKVKVECVKEYTDLTVDITINNKANWSPLTISLWDGDTEIVKDATVTDNKYSISGNYIGSSLTCQLSSGSKTSEKMPVPVAKDGATVTLEEKIIKLYFKLVESNQITYWGNKSYIYVWGSGSSLDNGWPGIEMTKEAEAYTWSIIIPSDLVGKTINYIINNGNGWQSPDSKITISADGNTVTDNQLGIK